jgi:uridine phosphorylase
MEALREIHTGILPQLAIVPPSGILCAHPRRARLIAENYLQRSRVLTNYRGMQVFVGEYRGHQVFSANCGIGAPAAAILVEELVLKGAKNIVRLGTNDATAETDADYGRLKLLKSTTFSLGLAIDYGFSLDDCKRPLFSSDALNSAIKSEAELSKSVEVELVDAYHLDAYYSLLRPDAFAQDHASVSQKISSKNSEGRRARDMESAALFMLANLRNLNVTTVLQTIKKHDEKREYENQNQELEIERDAIHLILNSLLRFEGGGK